LVRLLLIVEAVEKPHEEHVFARLRWSSNVTDKNRKAV
jgi:hypothetical protein